MFANQLESKSSQWAELNATTWVVHPYFIIGSV